LDLEELTRGHCSSRELSDADMATMLMSMCGAWIGEDGVQQGFPNQEDVHVWCMDWRRWSPTRFSKSRRRSKVDPV
jgi:hypothetical protein